MFAWFRKVNRKLKAKKCELFHKQVLFLGKVVSQSGISLNPGSVEKIQKWLKPKSSDDIMSFLAEPLYRLTKKGVAFNWSAEHESSFVYLKAALVSTTVLSFPLSWIPSGPRQPLAPSFFRCKMSVLSDMAVMY